MVVYLQVYHALITKHSIKFEIYMYLYQYKNTLVENQEHMWSHVDKKSVLINYNGLFYMKTSKLKVLDGYMV